MAYQITLIPSHQSFSLNGQESLLDAAARQQITLPYGCRNGLCGMCKGKLVQGRIKPPLLCEGLTPTEQAQGYILCCQAMPESDLVIEIEPLAKNQLTPPRRIPARVESIERLNHDVLRLRLALPESFRLQFLAGQYIDIILKDGRRRSFSIANAPHDDHFIELHIRHIDGGRFTTELFEHLHDNDIFRIEGALGSFFLRDHDTRPVIFMAGGTGFAPVKGIIEDTIARGISRVMHLYWGVRSREDLYLHELAQTWAQQYPNIRYTAVLSDPKPTDNWHGRSGFVHLAISHDFPNLSAYEIYASGSPAMVYAGRDSFSANGLSLANYYSDAFEFAKD